MQIYRKSLFKGKGGHKRESMVHTVLMSLNFYFSTFGNFQFSVFSHKRPDIESMQPLQRAVHIPIHENQIFVGDWQIIHYEDILT